MFTVKINTSGASYRDEEDPSKLDASSWQLCENLDQIIAILETGTRMNGNIFDINGNKVGEWKLEEI